MGETPTGLGEEGFIAIITNAVGTASLDPAASWSVTVSELSGTLLEDTVFAMSPRDTAVLTLPIATYDVSLGGLPLPCSLRNPRRQALVPQRGTTWTVRYDVVCSSLLTLEAQTIGPDEFRDESIGFRVRNDGTLRSGSLAANDTARFDDLDAGEYVLELANLRKACTVTTPGGRRRRIELDPPNTTVVSFGMICSNPAYRPRVTHFASTRRDGFSIILFEAEDPGAASARAEPDIDRFRWDMTDCRSNSVRVDAQPVWRVGLDTQSRVRRQTSMQVVSVIPTGELTEVDDVCTSLRVMDAEGNSTPLLEDLADESSGAPPNVRGFRTVLAGPPGARFLAFELEADDPDGDLVGGFLRLVYEDGTLGPADGIDETVLPTVVGFLGTDIPVLDPRSTGLPLLEGLRSVTVFVVDRQANATLWIDEDPMGSS